MEKFSIPAAAEPYVKALRSLIRTGVQAFIGLDESCLIDMPVVIAGVGSSARPPERAAEFIRVLERVIAKRLQGKDQTTALLLFAYGEFAGLPSRDRYERVAKLYNKSWKWENFRKEPLDRHLVAVYLSLYREGEELLHEPTTREGVEMVRVDAERRVLVAGGDYRLRSREVLYNFPTEDGQPREVIDRREIEVTGGEIDAWRQMLYYWGKGTAERPTFTLFGPGRLSILKEAPLDRISPPGRTYLVEVKFAEPLRKAERAQFMLHWRHDVRFSDIVRDDYHDGWRMAPIIPTDAFTVSVRFPAARRPRSVWHYEDIPETLAPGVPTDSNAVRVGSDGFATFTWRDLLVGYAYGLEWEW